MHTTQGILISCLIVVFCMWTIGGLIGYADINNPLAENSSWHGVADFNNFIGNGTTFLWDLTTFQIDGCPFVINAVFDLIAGIAGLGVVFFLRSLIPLLGGM